MSLHKFISESNSIISCKSLIKKSVVQTLKPIVIVQNRFFFSRSKPTENEDLDSQKGALEEEDSLDADIIDQKRNKSGLRNYHYNIGHNRVPEFSEDELETMELWKYRKLYGRHGNSSGIDIKSLWPSSYELKLLKEREKVEFPYSIKEMLQMAKEERLKEEKEIMDRQEEIKQNLKSLEKWKRDIKTKMEKKEREAKEALELRQRQIEEVREVLGYKISPFDPKFKEILDKRLEEDRKRKKKERNLRKQEMELKRLTQMIEEEASAPQDESILGKKIE